MQGPWSAADELLQQASECILFADKQCREAHSAGVSDTVVSELRRVRAGYLSLLDNNRAKDSPPWLDIARKRAPRGAKVVYKPVQLDQNTPNAAASLGHQGVPYRLAVYTQPLNLTAPQQQQQQQGVQVANASETSARARASPQNSSRQGVLSGQAQQDTKSSQLQGAGSSGIAAFDSVDLGAAVLLQQQLSVRASDSQNPVGVEGQNPSKYVLDATGTSLLRVGSGGGGSLNGPRPGLSRPPSYRERAAAAENAALEEEINAIQEDSLGEQLAVEEAGDEQEAHADDEREEAPDNDSGVGEEGSCDVASPTGSSIASAHSELSAARYRPSHVSDGSVVVTAMPSPRLVGHSSNEAQPSGVMAPPTASLPPTDTSLSPSHALSGSARLGMPPALAHLHPTARVMPVMMASPARSLPGGSAGSSADMGAPDQRMAAAATAGMLGPLAKKALASGMPVSYGVPDALISQASRDQQLGPLQRAMSRKAAGVGSGMVGPGGFIGTAAAPAGVAGALAAAHIASCATSAPPSAASSVAGADMHFAARAYTPAPTEHTWGGSSTATLSMASHPSVGASATGEDHRDAAGSVTKPRGGRSMTAAVVLGPGPLSAPAGASPARGGNMALQHGGGSAMMVTAAAAAAEGPLARKLGRLRHPEGVQALASHMSAGAAATTAAAAADSDSLSVAAGNGGGPAQLAASLASTEASNDSVVGAELPVMATAPRARKPKKKPVMPAFLREGLAQARQGGAGTGDAPVEGGAEAPEVATLCEVAGAASGEGVGAAVAVGVAASSPSPSPRTPAAANGSRDASFHDALSHTPSTVGAGTPRGGATVGGSGIVGSCSGAAVTVTAAAGVSVVSATAEAAADSAREGSSSGAQTQQSFDFARQQGLASRQHGGKATSDPRQQTPHGQGQPLATGVSVAERAKWFTQVQATDLVAGAASGVPLAVSAAAASGARVTSTVPVRVSHGMHLVPAEALPPWAVSAAAETAHKLAPGTAVAHVTATAASSMASCSIQPTPGTTPGTVMAPQQGTPSSTGQRRKWGPAPAPPIVVDEASRSAALQAGPHAAALQALNPGSPFDTGKQRLALSQGALEQEPPVSVPGVSGGGSLRQAAHPPPAAATQHQQQPSVAATAVSPGVSPPVSQGGGGAVGLPRRQSAGMVIRMAQQGQADHNWAPPGVSAAVVEQQRSASPPPLPLPPAPAPPQPQQQQQAAPVRSPRLSEEQQVSGGGSMAAAPVAKALTPAQKQQEQQELQQQSILALPGVVASRGQRTGLEASFDVLLIGNTGAARMATQQRPLAPPRIPGVSPPHSTRSSPAVSLPGVALPGSKRGSGPGELPHTTPKAPPPPPPPGPPPAVPVMIQAPLLVGLRKDATSDSMSNSVASSASVPSVNAYNSLIDSIKALGDAGAHRSHLRSLSKSAARRGVKGQAVAAEAAAASASKKGTALVPVTAKATATTNTNAPVAAAGVSTKAADADIVGGGGHDSDRSRSSAVSSQGASTLSLREERAAQYRGSVQAMEFIQRLRNAMMPQPTTQGQGDMAEEDDVDDSWM